MSKTTLAVEREVRAKIWDAQMILMQEAGHPLTISGALDLVLTEFLASRQARLPTQDDVLKAIGYRGENR